MSNCAFVNIRPALTFRPLSPVPRHADRQRLQAASKARGVAPTSVVPPAHHRARRGAGRSPARLDRDRLTLAGAGAGLNPLSTIGIAPSGIAYARRSSGPPARDRRRMLARHHLPHRPAPRQARRPGLADGTGRPAASAAGPTPSPATRARPAARTARPATRQPLGFGVAADLAAPAGAVAAARAFAAGNGYLTGLIVDRFA